MMAMRRKALVELWVKMLQMPNESPRVEARGLSLRPRTPNRCPFEVLPSAAAAAAAEAAAEGGCELIGGRVAAVAGRVTGGVVTGLGNGSGFRRPDDVSA